MHDGGVNRTANGSRVRDLMRFRRLMASGAARAIREAADLSYQEAEAVSGVHKTTIFRWESHERIPHGDAAIRYLTFLDELSGLRKEAARD